MSENGGKLVIEWRGREDYRQTWDHQLTLHEQRCQNVITDTVVLVEHNPVVTLGKRGQASNLLVNEQELTRRGVDLFRIERGGDITFHGPGQLVGYPIINLRQRGLGVREYVHLIESMLIDCLSAFDISAQTVDGLTGVWVGDTKLAAIGVAVRKGVSFHGFALNVSTDLSYYSLIVPCGITDRQVGSISGQLGVQVDLKDVKGSCETALRRHFE